MSRLGKQVTMVTVADRGILITRGQCGQCGVVVPSRRNPLLLIFRTGTSAPTWTLHTRTKDTCAMQSNKNKLKWIHKHAQPSTNYAHTHKHCHLLLTAAPWRLTQAPPLPLSFSFAPFCCSLIVTSVPHKKHTSSHDTS